MSSISNADLAQSLSQVLANWQALVDQHLTWQTGAADGGDNSDGVYSFTSPDGSVSPVKGLKRIQEDADGILNSAASHSNAAANQK